MVERNVINRHINAEPGDHQKPAAINPASELLLDVLDPDVGRHAHTATGASAVPLNLPAINDAQVEIA